MSSDEEFKPPTLGDYLSSINYTKKDVMRESAIPDIAEAKYPAFIIRRLLSYQPDALFEVSALNIFHGLSNKMQYDFLRCSLTKRKRFSKFEKEEKETQANIKLISDYYNLSYGKARDVLNVLTDEDVLEIKDKMDKGGRRSK